MLAIAYLLLVVAFGDAVCRRWFSYVSWPHRLATAILVGQLVGAWASYVSALALTNVGLGLLEANLVVGALLLPLTLWLYRRPLSPANRPSPANPRGQRWDLLLIGAFVVLVSWMMLSTYGYADGRLGMAVGVWSDFGPTSAIAQSFALGNNFPTEYPHFAGEPIRYHFLYYFEVGNLTRLGLDPALANNVLSISSMVAMLVLVMAVGRRLFRSALVGRIGAALFFVHGSLSFLPLLASYGSISEALAVLPELRTFVSSGFPYRGEEWGIWSQMVFLNQRHFASGIGLLLVVVLFLLDRLRARRAARPTVDRSISGTRVARLRAMVGSGLGDRALPGFLLCGAICGLLPLWNGAVFIAAAGVLAVWLFAFADRPQMVMLGVVAALLALPQLWLLQAGATSGGQGYPSFHWGYVIENPSFSAVASYAAFIFGPKLLLAGVALVRVGWRPRLVFLAFSSLVLVAFTLQLGAEVLANHKFINIWLVVANLFAAYGLLRLWQARAELRIVGRATALALAAIIAIGGVIEFMPIKNQGTLEFAMEGDPLFEWVRDETDRQAVFLSNIYVVHPITLAGRRLYLGWTYYAWSAGYDVRAREAEYHELFSSRSPAELISRLNADGIDYVAFDNGLRERDDLRDVLNEDVYEANFEPAFVAADGAYDDLAIYRVPDQPATGDAR
jgi:hypothetical protein